VARRAFITVDDYPGIPGAELAGCANDGRHVAEELDRHGFDDIHLLVNEQDTRAALTGGLEAFVAGLGPDDLGVWHRSSHGTQGAVQGDPTEPDDRREGIVPYDFRTAGIVWDDEIRNLLALAHPRSRVVVLMDTCFSGGVDRMAAAVTDHYRRVRYLPPAAWLPGTGEERERALAAVRAVAGQPAPKAYPVLLLSACQAQQVAYCADIDGEAQGAFTWAALKVLREREPGSYREWMYGSRQRPGIVAVNDRGGLLPSVDAPQTPVLHGSRGRVRWPVLEA
jgi:hypothetical protein